MTPSSSYEGLSLPGRVVRKHEKAVSRWVVESPTGSRTKDGLSNAETRPESRFVTSSAIALIVFGVCGDKDAGSNSQSPLIIEATDTRESQKALACGRTRGRTRGVFLAQRIGRKGEPMLLKTLELLVGPSYERIKVKPFEALVGRKCPSEDLPEGTLARDTSLKALQLDEGTERRMAPHLAVQFQAAGLLQQPGAGRLEQRGIDPERTHQGAKRLSLIDDLPVQSFQEVAELSTSVLCSGTA
jgi:hypothetical protein